MKTIDLLRVVSLVGAIAVIGVGVARAESGAHKTDGHGAAKPKGHVAGRASRVFEAAGDTAAPSGHGKSGGNQGHGSGWAYKGDSGPEHWGSLKPEFKACGYGTMQSPIDVRSSSTAAMTGIHFDYRIVPLTILNNGHTVQVNVEKGSSITVGGKHYELLQFHFHTPSEHVVDRRHFPLEMHLVHKGADGKLAVVGVFMQAGTDNVALQEIWNHLPGHKAAPAKIANVAINPRDLLPTERKYIRYMGSLTTPPCSEGVNWYVMQQPVTVGIGQIQAVTNIMGWNARPTQDRSNRLVMTGQ